MNAISRLFGYLAASSVSEVIADAIRPHCSADSANACAGCGTSTPPARVTENTNARPTLRNRVIPSSLSCRRSLRPAHYRFGRRRSWGKSRCALREFPGVDHAADTGRPTTPGIRDSSSDTLLEERFVDRPYGVGGFDHAASDGIAHEARGVLDAKLAHQPSAIGLDGLGGDAESGCQ